MQSGQTSSDFIELNIRFSSVKVLLIILLLEIEYFIESNVRAESNQTRLYFLGQAVEKISMDFIALLIIILGVTLIIWVMGFLKPTDANEDEQIPSEIIENRDLRIDGDVSDAPFVPQIGLEDLVAVLPKKYWQYFEHSSDEAYVIPNDNSVVGNLRMMLVWQEAIVQIGEHTELRFRSANSAFAFVGKVLRDEFVFRIGESETVICPIGDFEDSGEADRNDYVWSGPLKYKLLFRSQ